MTEKTFFICVEKVSQLLTVMNINLNNYIMNEIGKAMHALETNCSEEQLLLINNLLLAMMPNNETTREMIVVRFMEVIEGLGS